MLREESVEAWAWSHPRSEAALSLLRSAALSSRFPDSAAAGFLTDPLPHSHDWTNGVFVPTFMEVLEPWVRVWLVLKEEWTWSKVWAQRGFSEPRASWTRCSGGGCGEVFCAAAQGSKGARGSWAFVGPQFRVESFQGASRLWEEGRLPPSIAASERG